MGAIALKISRSSCRCPAPRDQRRQSSLLRHPNHGRHRHCPRRSYWLPPMSLNRYPFQGMLSHPVCLMVNAEAGAEGVAAEAEAAVWCTRSLLQLL